MQFQYSVMFLVRFWKFVDRTGTCWIWTGPKTGNGYGAIREDYPSRKQVAAHRASWVVHFGMIEPGFLICHHCDTPLCVRPDHLFIGTTQDNSDDKIAKGRDARGGQHGRRLHPERYPRGSAVTGARLTDDAVRTMRHRYADGGMTLGGLGREYGISKQTVWKIVRGLAWAHVS